ncbi:MAG: HAD-IA family hydrolase [Streptosporangiales bacterium]|nr:HAD-IA family hydrolase [Streptosporangiales bacterium]
MRNPGLAAARLAVRPDDCVVVEDAPAGIRAGRAAGATVVAVTSTHPADDLGDADAVVPSLAHLEVARQAAGLTLRVRGA